MTARTILYLRIALGVIAILLTYRIYRIIMEPIEFSAIKEKRYEIVTHRLEQLREAQLTFKEEYGKYAATFDQLIPFLEYAQVNIIERKDSSFMAYNKVYQTDMLKDTIIYRIIGQTTAKDKLVAKSPDLFESNFNADKLRFIPYTADSVEFTMATGFVDRNGVRVQVFEIIAPNTDFFADIYNEYKTHIKNLRTSSLIVGSLTEPTLSGNWK
ncbi:MAG: hypothetical protein ABR98_00860 [Cryomorphaceae bacterium BACL7 MAG-120910-bin2]|jgi:hypothetical protein|nr:MAG: hypothetical protein ABR98_00860 [Cryomorphaceae bacterium BACL7 MAG-120910-bin2]KRO69430.1 MAG: hypothetical protein ABR88_05505 [Cryomorphaceae bacterium BACL7 MAG-120322-bin74]KRO83012.1 MAG: hypothetical protein ABR87_04340 [Cryomorphaceae bacterium BACL7 MAG-121220-bin83]